MTPDEIQHLRDLPDGSLTRAEVTYLLDAAADREGMKVTASALARRCADAEAERDAIAEERDRLRAFSEAQAVTLEDIINDRTTVAEERDRLRAERDALTEIIRGVVVASRPGTPKAAKDEAWRKVAVIVEIAEKRAALTEVDPTPGDDMEAWSGRDLPVVEPVRAALDERPTP